MEALAHDLKLALDPVSFANELGLSPDSWQEKVLGWTGKRLLMNCCRQSGKSTIASVVALHRALFYPDNLILMISPSLRQSSELFRKTREWLYRLNLRPEFVEDNKLSCAFKNRSRIVSLPSSESTIRGYSGASLIIEDEASRVMDDLYRTVRPMLAVSNGSLILMSTPFGKRGHFFEEWNKGEGWERVEVKAPDCPRINGEFLEEEKRSLGDWWYRQEYVCEFVEPVDQVFGYDMVMSAMSSDIKPLFQAR